MRKKGNNLSENFLTPIYATIGMAIVTIIIGIFIEKHFVSKYSIGLNCVNVVFLAVVLPKTEILTLFLLIVYAFLGGTLIFIKWRRQSMTKSKEKFYKV